MCRLPYEAAYFFTHPGDDLTLLCWALVAFARIWRVIKTEGRWQIISQAWDNESEAKPIPADLIYSD